MCVCCVGDGRRAGDMTVGGGFVEGVSEGMAEGVEDSEEMVVSECEGERRREEGLDKALD